MNEDTQIFDLIGHNFFVLTTADVVDPDKLDYLINKINADEDLSAWARAYFLGRTCMAVKRYKDALFYFKVFFTEDIPRKYWWRFLLNIALCYLDLQDYHKAKEYYEQTLLKENPPENDRWCILFYIATCYFNLQDYHKAKEYYEQVLKENPPENRRWCILSNIAFCHLNIQDYHKVKAMDYLKEALRENPPENKIKNILKKTLLNKYVCRAVEVF